MTDLSSLHSLNFARYNKTFPDKNGITVIPLGCISPKPCSKITIPLCTDYKRECESMTPYSPINLSLAFQRALYDIIIFSSNIYNSSGIAIVFDAD